MTSRGNFISKTDKNNSEDDFEVKNVKGRNSETESFFTNIRKYANEGSNSRQLAIGGLSGWVSGYVAMKVGKTVATAVGGSLILLQIATHKGYININWSKVNKDLEGASKKLAQSSSDPSIPQMLDKAAVFLDEKVEKLGRLIHKKETRVRRWYHRITYGEGYPDGSEAFYFGFIGGSFFGLMSGCLL